MILKSGHLVDNYFSGPKSNMTGLLALKVFSSVLLSVFHTLLHNVKTFARRVMPMKVNLIGCRTDYESHPREGVCL